jgi:hypothetical protein
MGRSERSSPKGVERVEHWLGSDNAARSRQWAYPELLLGTVAQGRDEEQLGALAADLSVDLAELRRLQNELHDQVVRVAALEGCIRALMERPGKALSEPENERDAATGLPSFPSTTASDESSDRMALLARCEGFQVDSPVGLVGFVDGVRFGSRIDAPDFLEVRGGRLGRELLLIPIEAVEEISQEHERVVVRGVSPTQTDISHELVDRLRKALHVMSASLR